MSALVGHLGLHGDPTARITRMLDGCAERGLSHNPQMASLPGPVPGAFGHVGYPATAHSSQERRPFQHETGVTITADIRLDNRDELRSELVRDGRPTGDCELALLAYLRWGGEFAAHLVGDFAIAIFDPRSGEIVLARDHLGVRPVLYAAGDDWFVFGSTLTSVRDGADKGFGIYIDRLQHAMVEPLELAEPAATFYAGINRVPAASTLSWKAGQAPQIATYWQPERGDLRLNSDEEYEEAFREVFDQAIECRLEATRPVAAMLSGGLDSSSVVARIHTMGRTPLQTYGFVEASPGIGSDAPHVQKCQQAFPGQHDDFNEHDVASAYDFDAILADPDSPFDVYMGVLWTTTKRMAEADYGVVLTGIGGDETASINPRSYATELLHSGQRLKALREMSTFDGRKTFKRLGRFIGGEFAPRPVIERIRNARPAIPLFAKSLELAGIEVHSDDGKRLRASLDRLYGANPEWNAGDARISRIAGPMLTIGLERYDRAAARHGIEIRHPMSDKRFVEFCLALPSDQLQRNGWSKHVIRRSIPELPQSVAWRPKEVVGMGPAAGAIRAAHGPPAPVPPLPGVFGPVPDMSEPNATHDDHWMRHVISRWWANHA